MNATEESLPINLTIVPANTANLVPLNIGIILPDPSLLNPNDTDTHCLVGGGIAAIQMAAMEINNQSLIPGVYVNITYGLYDWKVGEIFTLAFVELDGNIFI